MTVFITQVFKLQTCTHTYKNYYHFYYFILPEKLNAQMSFLWMESLPVMSQILSVLILSLFFSNPLYLCISHITDASTIMWSVGFSLYLHLPIFSHAPLIPLSLSLALSLGLSGHRELWSKGIVGGRDGEINTTSRCG